MPIYEYKCAACGHTMDALQKMSDEPLKQCPECNENSLKKLVSAPSFRLKGGGWYETDFKTGNDKKRNLVEGTSGGGSASSGSSSGGSGGSSSSKESSGSADSPKADSSSKDSKSKESSAAPAKEAKPAAKETAKESSAKKSTSSKPAST